MSNAHCHDHDIKNIPVARRASKRGLEGRFPPFLQSPPSPEEKVLTQRRFHKHLNPFKSCPNYSKVYSSLFDQICEICVNQIQRQVYLADVELAGSKMHG